MLSTRTKISLAKIVYRILGVVRPLMHLSMSPEVIRDGIRWRLDLHEGIDLAIYLFGSFERSTVRSYGRLIQPGDTILDIGANIGAHTLHLARFAGPEGHVYAFEATSYACQKLKTNVALNPELAKRITSEHAVLMDCMESSPASTIYSSWPLSNANETHSTHLGRLMTTDGAASATIDNYFDERGILRLNFLKMDVDGNECTVLRGAENTLRRHHPRIVMELAPYALEEAGNSLEELVEIMNNLGYRLSGLDGNDPMGWAASNIRALIPEGGSINVLAVP